MTRKANKRSNGEDQSLNEKTDGGKSTFQSELIQQQASERDLGPMLSLPPKPMQ